MSKIAYGMVFADEVTELSIELHFYRHCDGLDRKVEHLGNAWRIAFPEVLPDGRRGYVWSEWDERSIRAWCENRYMTWWGPSASGKTTRAAILCLLHWMSAPDRTTIHMASSTGKMLRRRIWGEVTKYYKLYGEGVFPGQLKVAENAIVFSEQNIKAGLFGHAVQQGKVEDAVSNIIGVHNDFNVLVIDEMQGTPPAVAKAHTNLSIGLEFKFLGMGNPMSRLDLLGEWSEPKAGWDSITPELEEWETKRGKCIYFDGLKSPGVKDPKRFPFMLKASEIEETRRIEGENSPDWWTMRRGFVPPEGLLPTMITESMLVEGRAFERVTWGLEEPLVVIGVDPAYSSKGDKCMVYPLRYGKDKDGKLKLEFMAPRQVLLTLARETPMATFITAEIVRIATDLGITCDSIAMDCTGMQGMLADSVESQLSGKMTRIFFGGHALKEFQVSAIDTRTGDQAYKNRATQLMGHMAQYVKSGMIRNLDKEAARQLCMRQLEDKVSPIRIEPKDEYKARHGESPDLSDSALIALALVRETLFITPEGARASARDGEANAIEKDVDSWDDNWLSG